jgi:FkbM family methyltransferase
MAVVMLDVGSRNGESLGEFVRWPFDVIHAFEPMPAQFANIVKDHTDERIYRHNFGLSDVSGTLPVYGSDDRGEASVFQAKVDIHDQQVTECRFMRATTFFETALSPDDTIYMKLNCEGSEIAILNDLIGSGQIGRVAAFRVEFDISRVPGHELEADLLLERLREIGYDRYTIGSNARITPQGLVDDVPQVGSHHERLHAWLESVWSH